MKTKSPVLSIMMILFIAVLAGCSSTETPSTGQATNVAPAVAEQSDTVAEMPTKEPAEEAEAEAETNIEAADESAASEPVSFKLEAWADNWFAAYLGEALIVEDSVSINTERSFNAETATFVASYPLHLNFSLKDFKQNDTGLEYIGARNQQMGDGGFILQLTDQRTGEIVAVSNADWACTVIHEAPLDKACENEAKPIAGVAPCEFSDLGEPDGWMDADFDDSGWAATTVHSVSDVSPKDGYNQINWDANAELIWGPDLETNNSILCRLTVADPDLN